MNNAQKIAAKAKEVNGEVSLATHTAEVLVNGVSVLRLPITVTERIELSCWMDRNDGFSDSDEE